MERRTAASPVWIQLLDAFTGRRPAGPIAVALEKRVSLDWVPLDHPHQISPAGDLGFVNLGRTADPAAVGSFDVRITPSCAGMIAEDANGRPSVTTTITAWPPDSPVVQTQPEVVRFFPGPAYPYPPGAPVLAGRVVDTSGDPVGRVRVFSITTIQGVPHVEEARTHSDGRFRLPLRWSAGATDVNAALGGRSAAITVSVPADLSTTHQLTLS
jgi:hypothetical protein